MIVLETDSRFQVADDSRPFLAADEKAFRQLLTQNRIPFTRELHFGDEEPSISAHFRLLDVVIGAWPGSAVEK